MYHAWSYGARGKLFCWLQPGLQHARGWACSDCMEFDHISPRRTKLRSSRWHSYAKMASPCSPKYELLMYMVTVVFCVPELFLA